VQGRVYAACQAGEHALQQHDEVGRPDPVADRPGLLGATQQQVERGEQVLAQRAGDRDGTGKSRLAAASPAILARKPKNASPGSAASARARASLTRLVIRAVITASNSTSLAGKCR
jgi:uridine phosphorylase